MLSHIIYILLINLGLFSLYHLIKYRKEIYIFLKTTSLEDYEFIWSILTGLSSVVLCLLILIACIQPGGT